MFGFINYSVKFKILVAIVFSLAGVWFQVRVIFTVRGHVPMNLLAGITIGHVPLSCKEFQMENCNNKGVCFANVVPAWGKTWDATAKGAGPFWVWRGKVPSVRLMDSIPARVR